MARIAAVATSLKRTNVFRAVHQRGRWARGASLSIGVLRNHEGRTRIGLRTRRGLKGAVTRNRLKRQLRTIIYTRKLPLQAGLDAVVVIHPTTPSQLTADLECELRTLCQRLGILC